MKKKTYIKQGAFPPNSFISVVDINGTLSYLAFVYLNAGVLEYAQVSLLS